MKKNIIMFLDDDSAWKNTMIEHIQVAGLNYISIIDHLFGLEKEEDDSFDSSLKIETIIGMESFKPFPMYIIRYETTLDHGEL